tara:strand:- start:7659 stop:7805 length:147 start_codon:yes stop_codon:yes gene_type:complete
MQDPTKKERITAIIVLVLFTLFMGTIFYLAATNGEPTDNSNMMMEMFP